MVASLPAVVRVNTQVPFPAMVQGGSGVQVAKNNGVWIVSLVPGQLVSIMQASGFIPSFTGQGLLDFGAFPGGSDAQLVVTGQAGILAGSIVRAFLMPAQTADHSADEHWVDGPVVMAGNIVPGQGFTIYGNTRFQMPALDGVNPALGPGSANGNGGNAMTYGKWTVGWAWQ